MKHTNSIARAAGILWGGDPVVYRGHRFDPEPPDRWADGKRPSRRHYARAIRAIIAAQPGRPLEAVSVSIPPRTAELLDELAAKRAQTADECVTEIIHSEAAREGCRTRETT